MSSFQLCCAHWRSAVGLWIACVRVLSAPVKISRSRSAFVVCFLLLLCAACITLSNGCCIIEQDSGDLGHDLVSLVVRIERKKRMRSDARMHLHFLPAACFGCCYMACFGRAGITICHVILSGISSKVRAESNEQELALDLPSKATQPYDMSHFAALTVQVWPPQAVPPQHVPAAEVLEVSDPFL